jgi:chromosome segregation ATPase
MSKSEVVCMHEARLSNIERDIAELQARVDGKKNDINEINKELLRDRQQQTELLEKVTRVTVLLEEGQKQRKANNRKIDDLEDKIDKLQNELADYRNDLTDFASSQRSFRNTMLALIPIISILVGIALHFIKI